MSEDAREARLDELLLDWEEHRDSGEGASVEELCADCPELADDLRARIASLRVIDALLDVRPGDRGPAEGRLPP